MAEIRCSNCGKENPDFFDNCQFCQEPLRSESTLQPGENPAEMDTGELEPILPDWLQDARQQSRDSGDAESFSPETQPRVQANEPLDLLAGLAAQDDSDEDEVPDWLASINPVGESKSNSTSVSDEQEEPSNFFAQFSQTEPQMDDTSQSDSEPSLMGGLEPQPESQADELGGWLSQTSDELSETGALDFGGTETEDNSWMSNLGEPESSVTETPAGKEPEDLSWLHDLESVAKETGDLSSPQVDAGFDLSSAQAESSGEDLDWLNDLGGTPIESSVDISPSQPESSQDDSDWLKNLGGESPSSTVETSPSQPESSQEDLSWMANLGASETDTSEGPAPAQSGSSEDDLSWMANLGASETDTSEEPAPAQSGSSEDDLSWMANLGASEADASEEPAPAQSGSSEDDLSWMANLGGSETDASEEPAAVQFTPPGTAPLDENAGRDSTPDWLKSAMEEPSMPAPGDLSMDWFADTDKSAEAETTSSKDEAFDVQMDEANAPSQDEPASVSSNINLSLGNDSGSSSQDIDALFNIDMPDLASEDEGGAAIDQSGTDETFAAGDESLAPAELPSWVRDMRPVDSAISETSYAGDDEQEPESEGPLAGFSGVIPSAPIGSSLRPKAFSLKLQVSDEQQAGASLIEQIIVSETVAHPSIPSTVVASQKLLRWALSGVFLIVFSVMLGLGLRNFDILATDNERDLSDLIEIIPAEAPVLLVVDYEPAVAGEMAAATGPVLDQLAQSRQSGFTFISMSPNGSAMAEHLMLNVKVTNQGNEEDGQYLNKGFLPGGSAGVLGFINETAFSNFEAIVLLTDNADSGRVWIEQLQVAKQARPEIASKPLIVVSSAQAGPMLEPYVSSGQVNVMINGLSDAAKYEYLNQSRPGIARTYWDSFGAGLLLAVLSIVLGSVWNLFMGIRERRAEVEQG